ncbi:Xaa-Pro aminopeptidase 1-like Protein, partial [Tribolium castaneum]
NIGFIPSNYVKEKELLGLQQYEWYVNDMSRQRSESLLKQEDKEGCFVVRNSSTKGRKWTKKIHNVRKTVQKLQADALVVTSLDEIGWLLNIRGRDIPSSPLVRSYLLLDMERAWLYVNRSQLEANHVARYLTNSAKEANQLIE